MRIYRTSLYRSPAALKVTSRLRRRFASVSLSVFLCRPISVSLRLSKSYVRPFSLSLSSSALQVPVRILLLIVVYRAPRLSVCLTLYSTTLCTWHSLSLSLLREREKFYVAVSFVCLSVCQSVSISGSFSQVYLIYSRPLFMSLHLSLYLPHFVSLCVCLYLSVSLFLRLICLGVS